MKQRWKWESTRLRFTPDEPESLARINFNS